MPDSRDLLVPDETYAAPLREKMRSEHDHQLLDLLTAAPICPVCLHKGTPIGDDWGIAYRHEGRHYLCRVTPKALERS